MDISTIFPSSDNLYKFLFMGGVLLIAFSFVYPLEKKQKIELDINEYNKEVSLLNRDIFDLNKNTNELKSRSEFTQSEMKALQDQNDSTSIFKFTFLRNEFNKQLDSLQSRFHEIKTKSIILDSQKARIQILQSHVASFNVFRWLMLLIGLVFTVFGIYNWFRVTRVNERYQQQEMERKFKS